MFRFILMIAITSLAPLGAFSQEMILSGNPDLIYSTANDAGPWGSPDFINSLTNDTGPLGSPDFIRSVTNDAGVGITALELSLLTPNMTKLFEFAPNFDVLKPFWLTP